MFLAAHRSRCSEFDIAVTWTLCDLLDTLFVPFRFSGLYCNVLLLWHELEIHLTRCKRYTWHYQRLAFRCYTCFRYYFDVSPGADIIYILFEIAELSWWKVVEPTLSFLLDETLVVSFCLINQQQQTAGVSHFSASRAALRYTIFWLYTFQMLNQHAPPLNIQASETLGSISVSSYLQNATLWSWDRGLFRQSV